MLGQQGLTDRPTEAYRILVVDDYPDTSASAKLLLELKGHVAHTASSGREAIREFGAFAPDLVLLDTALSDMNGIEVAQAIHETPAIKKPIIAAMSVEPSLDDKRCYAWAGFDYYLMKPVEPVVIDQLIQFEQNTIADKLLALAQRQVKISYDWMCSQLEFGGLLLDVAAITGNEAKKKRSIQMAKQVRERTGTYLINETRLLPIQMSTLRQQLTNFAARFLDLPPDQ